MPTSSNEEIKHLAPVFIGDTIYAETTVLEKRESRSKPDRGIVRVETVARNHRGEPVLSFRRRVLIPKASAEVADEQVMAREMVVEVEHPTMGTLRQTGNPIKVGGERRLHRFAPALGADTEEILASYLGYSPERIQDLRSRGVV